MQVDLIITLNEDSLGNLNSVVERLKNQGVAVSDVTTYGVIMGKGDSSLINKLSKDKEIESVIEDYYTQLPPPESEIQ
ncbi:hypothetical protein [Chitinophaga sp. S165]|uniref:hypothetical protein n=1 Tax=Chitinophaga sp. S165 TaxID=2135462 RepID=UPI000D708FAF|nr:hypothetical protein [Chitinophaga sp. S165]PWV47020.1 hypothetical protein C7475_109107 [Chitinophaga sp. S165]